MATQPAIADYPVRFEVMYPEGQNRFMILIRWLLALPHVVVLYFLQIVAAVLLVVAWFVLLITARYPNGMFNFISGYLRWQLNVTAYVLFHNTYPPFSMSAGEYEPLLFEVEQQEHHNRLTVLFRLLLVIPHLIVLYFLQLIAYLVGLLMVIAVLVTGNYPRGMFDFLVGVGRWGARVSAYMLLLTDKYPPFAMR